MSVLLCEFYRFRIELAVLAAELAAVLAAELAAVPTALTPVPTAFPPAETTPATTLAGLLLMMPPMEVPPSSDLLPLAVSSLIGFLGAGFIMLGIKAWF
mmetsp:Transcript_7109/g.12788  ORF Transcript_7109/g.12788 Transcript_7109/m.12788 type:complete len:99 (-) Transcript_7109:344-640(-)